MATELFANLAQSTLAADITSTATSLGVASAAGFSAAVTGTSQFRIVVDSELMIVTNVSGTTFTVTRGADGTTAAAHTSGAVVAQVVTAGSLSAAYAPVAARAVLAKASAAQSISNGTATAIALAAEQFDTDALHDTATNNSRVVLDKVGKWFVHGSVGWNGNGTGSRRCWIAVNGTEYADAQIANAGSDGVMVSATTLVVASAVTDYIELIAYQNSGGTLSTSSINPGSFTWLAATYLGA